jgi:hypothetical protein
MTNAILELIGLLSAFCGLVALMFLVIIYLTVRRLGGNIERRHVIVIGGVSFLFFLGAVMLNILGSTI